MYKELMLALRLSEPEVFKEEFEAQIATGTYVWVSYDTLIYNKNYHNIFMDIRFEYLTETMSIELYPIDLIKGAL